MSSIKVTNLQHASAASPAIVLASDGTATAQLSSLNGGALSGARNRIINGDMRIDQRNAGASVTPTSLAYTVDRWAAAEQTDGSITVQRSTTAPAGFANSLLVTVTSADASLGATQYAVIDQPIEGTNVDDLAWGTASAKTVTLSFWVRSSVTGTFGGSIQNSAQDRSYPFSYTISSANTWEQKSITIAGDTSGTWLTTTGTGLAVWFSLAAGSTYSGTSGAWGGALYFAPTSATNLLATNGATFYITGVQLEAGTVATPFERRSYGQELALCQRYYERRTFSGNDPVGAGGANTGNTAQCWCNFHWVTEKRAAPTCSLITAASTLQYMYRGGSFNASTFDGFVNTSPTTTVLTYTLGSSSGTVAGWTRANGTLTFDASAEL